MRDMQLKPFSDYLKESMLGVKIDSEQLYLLYSKKISTDAFAVNCRITEKEASDIQKLLTDDNIRIISSDTLKEKYDKDVIDPIIQDMDKYVDAGIRYGSQIGVDEKDDKALGDAKFVEKVLSDFVGLAKEAIQEFFWKKSGENGYLFFILSISDEIDRLVNKL